MLKVVKIGGGVLDDPVKEEEFLQAFIKLEHQKILVHGGGMYATKLAARLGVETTIIDGRRITDAPNLEVITLAYPAINKRLTARIQALGQDAIGISGADLGILKSEKRVHPTIDYGFVGDIISTKIDKLKLLLELEIVPVFCAITSTSEGTLLNTNADTIASEIASAGHADELIFCFEKGGVLEYPDDDSSVLSSITLADIDRLTSTGKISTGMIPKLHNAVKALKKGVSSVRITHYSDLNGGTIVES